MSADLPEVDRTLTADAAPRARAWLLAAIAVLLVGTYLALWLTYARLHLPPGVYDQRPAGSSASKLGADFRLVSLRQTERLVDYRGEAHSAEPDSVWVLAELEVTPHALEENFNCAALLIDDRRRTWEAASSSSVIRDGERCAPDDAVPGQVYPIEMFFEVPIADVGSLVGITLQEYTMAPDPILTPPA